MRGCGCVNFKPNDKTYLDIALRRVPKYTIDARQATIGRGIILGPRVHVGWEFVVHVSSWSWIQFVGGR